jgi:hypothetical protein
MLLWTHLRSLLIAALVVGFGMPIAITRAQQAGTTAGPNVPEIPVPRIKTPMGTLPGVNELPVCREMPDVMVMRDGTRVTTPQQWQKRREEIRKTLEYYAVGQMPPAPGNVKGKEVRSETALDGKVKYRLVHLTFGPEEKLVLDIGIFTPAQGGPFPTVIMMGSAPPGAKALPRTVPAAASDGRRLSPMQAVSPVPLTPVEAPEGPTRDMFGNVITTESVANQFADLFRRDYAVVVFSYTDCGEDTTLRNPDGSWAFRNTRFFPAYPGYDWGLFGAWAWGSSRIADYLVTDSIIDKTRLIITGGSRCGKAAMVAAAFDDRLMGAPLVTGGGGMGAYRFAGPRNSETLEKMQRNFPNWFSPNLHEFSGHKEKLPFDQHWFLALAAPRPFLALEGDTDTISLPEAVRQSILGAQPAYELLGAKDRLGVHYSHHGHTVTPEDWTAMMDFFDKYSRGKKIDRTFDRFPTEAELDAALAAAAAERKASPPKKQ